jgi:hypothetical protein
MPHVEGVGDMWYRGVERGVSDPVMGTTGEGRRVEGICVVATKLPPELAGCTLYYRVHMSEIGWSPWIREGGYAGTRGQGRQIEAMEMRFQVEQDSSEPTATLRPTRLKTRFYSDATLRLLADVLGDADGKA